MQASFPSEVPLIKLIAAANLQSPLIAWKFLPYHHGNTRLGCVLTDAKKRASCIRLCLHRLQNSPYFCVFNYSLAAKEKVWNEAENRERDWGGMQCSYYIHKRGITFRSHVGRYNEGVKG